MRSASLVELEDSLMEMDSFPSNVGDTFGAKRLELLEQISDRYLDLVVVDALEIKANKQILSELREACQADLKKELDAGARVHT